jgi:thioesterase domain-containing protein
MYETELQTYLHDQIPITQDLGVTVHLATLEHVVLKAPLGPNINHKKTAFGGSLYSIATLACWSLVHLNMKHLNISCEIVIAEGNSKYLAPVTTDFEVSCQIANAQDWGQFTNTLARKRMARVRLSSEIYQGSKCALEYLGDFVAIKHRGSC